MAPVVIPARPSSESLGISSPHASGAAVGTGRTEYGIWARVDERLQEWERKKKIAREIEDLNHSKPEMSTYDICGVVVQFWSARRVCLKVYQEPTLR